MVTVSSTLWIKKHGGMLGDRWRFLPYELLKKMHSGVLAHHKLWTASSELVSHEPLAAS